MSLILDGTNGLSDIDGSAATPAIRGTDANTGIFFPAADTIAFSEGGVESMRIDSSGNVGIGTSSPTGRMEVAATGVPVLRLSSTQTSPNNILMTGGSSYNYGVIGVNTGNNTSTGDIFQLGYTASAGAAPTSVLQWSSAAKCIGLNTTPSTTGTGITFPATQSASTDANTLDDYEEGTWTPTLKTTATNFSTLTYSSQIGDYVKIGSYVYCQFFLQINSVSGGTGDIQLSGLPFASSGSGRPNSGGYIQLVNGWTTNNPSNFDASGAASTDYNIQYRATSNGVTTALPASAAAGSAYIRATILIKL
jgi:hypothetical protein